MDKASLCLRVSNYDQNAATQVVVLAEWDVRSGFKVVHVYEKKESTAEIALQNYCGCPRYDVFYILTVISILL